MRNRRDVVKLGLGTGAALALAGPAGSAVAVSPASGTASGDLSFDPAAFTVKTATIATETGDRHVVYRFWRAIPYVRRPVDVAYQSLNVSQPIEIDGKAVETGAALILFSNSIGGYMPSSVATAQGIGGGGMMGGPPPGMAGAPPGLVEAPSGSNAMLSRGRRVSNAEQALAAGYVVVEPGARGRTLTDAEGVFYGVAPAAIVDLKAAVRYVRANRGRLPGDTERIVSSGTSAGGALSALLGASGDSGLYAADLAALGAAEASDAIFAAGAWCPIADLDHADMAYEWNWGGNPLASGARVDREASQALRTAFADYQAGLGLEGRDGFGPLTAETYGAYLLEAYLLPAAGHYLAALPEAERAAYLAAHPGIGWQDGEARFGWDAFLAHVGPRKKGLPAFDAFDLSSGENNLFGLGTTKARHFTPFSLRHATGDAAAQLDADLPATLRRMNPMPFILEAHPGRARHWWIRVGAKDSDTSLSVVGNLAAALAARGAEVDARMYWDAGHGANEGAGDFMRWIASLADPGR
ncbi:hypothetical protein LGR54_03970 [Ancylobacter sp. Lp-2]|uniref:subtype B tannase n=1 Tax=Ancylobacter sp. Lp-2 TaxID=2881339 RepID=UPI001E2D2568|nr:subtype B tannase [Ancylobacter sp. Lp-2]MCB4767751.1 hypothetical protein [Ancylobacter sp. Lp-2]